MDTSADPFATDDGAAVFDAFDDGGGEEKIEAIFRWTKALRMGSQMKYVVPNLAFPTNSTYEVSPSGRFDRFSRSGRGSHRRIGSGRRCGWGA